jgi:nucleoside-diphosphate-sugar epimerase
MRALIVGCGYVGLPLGAELVSQGHQVWGLRRSAAAAAEMAAAGIVPVQADITRPDTLDAAPAGCDWVVHCVTASGGGVQEYRQAYLEGTRNLLTWMRAHPPQKLVYTSSTSVYGQSDDSWVEETSATEPVAETARILLQTEQLLLNAAKQHRFPAVILRCAGLYGHGRGYWLRQFLSGSARLEGGGGRFLNMLHRDDAVGIIQAALKAGRPGESYNAVDDAPVSQLALFKWLAAQLDRPLPPSAAEETGGVRKRGGTNKRVSNRKLKQELGYVFQYPTFREGYAAELRRIENEDRSVRVGPGFSPPGTKSS